MSYVQLTEATAERYLRSREEVRVGERVTVETLGGGVSNAVLRIETAGDCFVVKQPMANLAVEADWPADIGRIHNEAEATRVYGRALAEAMRGNVLVPEVRFEDRENYVVAISCVPPEATMWKRQLLDGTVDVNVARTLGTALGATHSYASSDDSVRAVFADRTPFEQLRLDPYHQTVADRHPELEPAIQREIERVRSVKKTLVHGDYSPKNVLVMPGGCPVWLLDFEVAHWGDPAFDTAFMLNHLLIKSMFAEQSEPYVRAAQAFWDSYDSETRWDIETETIRELAVLMLARVDGKSPVEYVTRVQTKEAMRTVAGRALTEEIETLDAFVDLVETETPR